MNISKDLKQYKADDFLIYLRKSRADNASETIEEVLSKHEKQLQDYAIRIFGKKIPEENIFREVVSGETISARPEIKKVLNIIEGENIKGVLVFDVPRLSRGDWEDGGRILNAFRYSNTLILTPPKENSMPKTYDLKDSDDYKSFKGQLSAGNEYLEYTKEILLQGRIVSMNEGNYLGSVAPYGYRKVWIDKSPTLEIDESEAPGVRMIFELYADGVGVYKIKKIMDQSPYQPRNKNKWSEYTIRRMLQSPIYIGKIRWNYRKQKKVYQDGEVKKTRPLGTDEEVVIVDGKHPAIISEELFEKVQAIFGTHTKEKSNTELRNPYASLLKCQCGQSMVLATYKTNRSPRLKCKYQVDCGTISINYDDVNERIISTIESYIKDFELKLSNQDNNQIAMKMRMLDDLNKELNKLYEKEEELYDFLEDGIYTKEIFLKRKAKNDSSIEEVKEKIKKAKSEVPKRINYEEKILKFKNVAETLKYEHVKPKDKNILLKEIIEKIVYHREKKNHRYEEPEFTIDVYFKE